MTFKSRFEEIVGKDVARIALRPSGRLHFRFAGPSVHRLDVVSEIFKIMCMPLNDTRTRSGAWHDFSKKYDLLEFEQIKKSLRYRDDFVPEVKYLRNGSIDIIIAGAGLILAVIAAFTSEQERLAMRSNASKKWRKLFPPDTTVDIRLVSDDETI